MGQTPLVSVIIPTRDRREMLERALVSVTRQTYPSLEIIVVDDASGDGTAEMLEAHPDVTLIRCAVPIGAAKARNLGVEESKGTLLAFLDSDDEWLPPKIERQVHQLMNSPSTGAIYCRHLAQDDSTGELSEPRSNLYTGDITEELLSGRCPRTVSLFLLRRAAFDSAGGFDPELKGFQDTDLWIRVAQNWAFDAVDEALAIVHNHAGARVTTDITARTTALDLFLEKWGPAMEERIGPQGVQRYVRNQLAVAQGAVVLSSIRSGQRWRALKELKTYVVTVGFVNPPQMLGLVVACLAGEKAHERLRSVKKAFTH
jgi:glycosyltransferase involved in cell wall biosynthesis